MVRIKVCGVTSVSDAIGCVEAGVDALGLNFWPGSTRFCEHELARHVVREVAGRVELVGVFVDEPRARIEEILVQTGVEWAQLHGSEPPEVVQSLLPRAFKALRAAGPEVVGEARRYPGQHLLLDACVPGEVGGTGRTFDWGLAREVARERELTLAGGLHPGNVAEAIHRVRPYRVDVASGVESAPGKKDLARVRDLVQAAREA